MAEARAPGQRDSKPTTVEQLKVPPHSLEAEQSVLGGLMLNSDLFDQVAEKVVKEDFYSRSHQLIFSAMSVLLESGHPLDLVTVSEELDKMGELDAVGGIPYLSDIARNTPSVANLTAYAGIVRERAVVREMIKVANEIADAGFNPDGRDSSQLLDLAESRVFQIAEQRANANEGPEDIKAVLSKTVDKIEELFNNPHNGVTGVSTGYTDLDKMTAGLQPSDLVIVAARPSMGKCIVSGSRIIDPETGALNTIDQLVETKQATVLSVTNDYRFKPSAVSQFIDDGIKPVFRVRTALGREITTTLTHPFLTGQGWQPLGHIKARTENQPGEWIAVPRELPVFGNKIMAEHEVKLLAYMIGDGGVTQDNPKFTNSNSMLAVDFADAVQQFDGVSVKSISSDTRTHSYRVSRDLQQCASHRMEFAKALKQALVNKGMTQAALAEGLDVCAASVTYWCQGKQVPQKQTFEALLEVVGLEQADLPEYAVMAGNVPNVVTEFLMTHVCWGALAQDKRVPEAVFQLPEPQLALFINRLYSCDGSAFVMANGQARITYATSSAQLARDLQHLLLRFGIVAKLRAKMNHHDADGPVPFELEILAQESLQRFIDRIGIFGKEEALQRVSDNQQDKQPHSNADLLPDSINDYILAKKGERSWPEIFAGAGAECPEGFNPHLVGQSRRNKSRAQAKFFAELLKDDYLAAMAGSALYWDEVVGIESLGERQVYDLTVPELHNFVAEDVCVHNTTFAMNLCEHAAMNEDKPVLIFSLEMPSEQIMMRMLASLGRVDQTKIRTGQLNDDDWARVSSTMGIMMEQGKMYIDDGSGLTPTEVRSRARRVARENGGIAMIMVDYLQLMQVPALSDNRTLEIAEISRSLKALAKELQCPVVALSQLNRSLEQRADKRPVNSDLRESGSIEQDADLIMFIYRDEVYHPDTAEKGQAEIIIGKQRNGPIGKVPLTFQGQFSRFDNYSGTSFDYDE